MYLETALKNMTYRCKGRGLKIYLLLHGCKVGKKLKCLQFPNFRLVPNKNITIGNNVTIGENITIEIIKEAELKIGNQVNLTRNITLAANTKIEIGNYCLIGENVSLRDANHQTKKDKLIIEQASDSEPIIIEEDVWVGANCVVLKGSKIAKGAVIGANSLVLKKSSIEPYGIYTGNPVKLLKTRT